MQPATRLLHGFSSRVIILTSSITSRNTSETSGVDNTQFKALTLLIKVSPL